MQEVTEKVISAMTIERQANYDALTNLPNRVLFNDRLSNFAQRATRKGNKLAVLFIDLDRFKPVNDNHGHQAGDKLLIEAAKRISSCVLEADTVSRLSGDEFGVILTDIDQDLDVLLIIEKIHLAMQESYSIDNKLLYCSASIGISMFPADGQNAQPLIQKADQAMYEVKSSGRNGWQFYTKEMQSKSEYRHNLLNDLINAVNENKLSAHFQAIFDLKSMQIRKCETLSRWQKDDGTFIPPYQFINLAEESGLINKIDLSMLENSAKAIRDINKELTDVELTINVSPRLFHTKDKALENWLASIKLISQQISVTVEITERLLTSDSETALSVLNTLKEYGVKIAIDDFGTGYSSLSYLVKFPVDLIKIDRSFIDLIGKDSSAETLIETILLMAKRLDIQVVSEGIETQEQLDFLQLHQCDFGQGYFLGRPMALENFKSCILDNIS
jgi:diguanylate cyclase (GGDEF)-like protein